MRSWRWWRRAAAVVLAVVLMAVLVVTVRGAFAQGRRAVTLRWRTLPVFTESSRIHPDQIVTISCPTSQLCVALVQVRGGALLERFAPETASPEPIIGYPIPRAYGSLLSCTSMWTCVLGGGRETEVTVDGGAFWTGHRAPTGRMVSLQCTAAAPIRCVAELQASNGTDVIDVGDPITGSWHSVVVGADASGLTAPSCTPDGTCVLTASRLFERGLWVYESADFGRSWTASPLPGPSALTALAGCAPADACVVATQDLAVNGGGVDTSASFGSWRAARLSNPRVLRGDSILREPTTVSCTDAACVVVYAQVGSPAPTSILYGSPRTGAWTAFSIDDVATGDARVYISGRSFTIDGRCVLEWDGANARRGCPT